MSYTELTVWTRFPNPHFFPDVLVLGVHPHLAFRCIKLNTGAGSKHFLRVKGLGFFDG